jgi:hypothetical protein
MDPVSAIGLVLGVALIVFAAWMLGRLGEP